MTHSQTGIGGNQRKAAMSQDVVGTRLKYGVRLCGGLDQSMIDRPAHDLGAAGQFQLG